METTMYSYNIIYCDKDVNNFQKYYSFTLTTKYSQSQLEVLIKSRKFDPMKFKLPGLKNSTIQIINNKVKKENRVLFFDQLISELI